MRRLWVFHSTLHAQIVDQLYLGWRRKCHDILGIVPFFLSQENTYIKSLCSEFRWDCDFLDPIVCHNLTTTNANFLHQPCLCFSARPTYMHINIYIYTHTCIHTYICKHNAPKISVWHKSIKLVQVSVHHQKTFQRDCLHRPLNPPKEVESDSPAVCATKVGQAGIMVQTPGTDAVWNHTLKMAKLKQLQR